MKKPRRMSHGRPLALLLAAAAAGACTPSGGTSGVDQPGGSGGAIGRGNNTGGSNTSAGSGGRGTVVGGTGGQGVGTTPSTGGSTVVQKLCATKTTIMNPVLIDFETYTGTVTADNFGTAFGGTTPNTGPSYTGPYAYPENATAPAPTLSLLAGHPPSQWAVAETIMQAKVWGMGGGIWMGCANASTYKGVSFWVRGSGPLGVFKFSLSMDSTVRPDATNPAGGGTCPGTDSTCIAAYKDNIPLTMDWTQVQIPWSEFTPGLSGTAAVTPNGDNITGLGWSVPLMFTLDPSAMGDAAGPYDAVPGDLVINIDDVSFIR